MMKTQMCLIRIYWRLDCICLTTTHVLQDILAVVIYWRVSHSSASSTYTQDPNLFITVPLDARVLDGIRPSAGAVLTTKSLKFHWLPPSNYCCDTVL